MKIGLPWRGKACLSRERCIASNRADVLVHAGFQARCPHDPCQPRNFCISFDDSIVTDMCVLSYHGCAPSDDGIITDPGTAADTRLSCNDSIVIHRSTVLKASR